MLPPVVFSFAVREQLLACVDFGHRLSIFAVLMSISSIYFAKWGAKFASGASEKVLQKLLGCFMLVSVPFVLSKTLWWKQAINRPSEQAATEDNSVSSTIARNSAVFFSTKEKCIARFHHQLQCCCEHVAILLPQVAALIPNISAAIQCVRDAGIQLQAAFQSKMDTDFPNISAAAAKFSSATGLTEAGALQRGGAYMLLGAAGGCISGMLGVGGGVVITPCLAAFSAMPHLTILGTAMLTMVPATISGTLQHHAVNNILWPQAGALAAGSLLGAAAGSNVAVAVSEDSLRFAFCVMMSLLGFRTLLR